MDCGDGPVLTWANFGDGFMTERCQTCHAEASPDRRGAPDAVVFDREADVRSQVGAVRAAVDGGTMPPGGGLTEAERALLERWLVCDL